MAKGEILVIKGFNKIQDAHEKAHLQQVGGGVLVEDGEFVHFGEFLDISEKPAPAPKAKPLKKKKEKKDDV